MIFSQHLMVKHIYINILEQNSTLEDKYMTVLNYHKMN